MSEPRIQIGGRAVEHGAPCWVIAEAGANADNDTVKARELVASAVSAGADAVKFQTYSASKISTRTAPLYWHGPEKSQWECFDKLDKLPLETLAQLVQDHSDIVVFSTPFDLVAVDELDQMGVQCFKVASADITYHELLRRVAQKGKPIILSTGAADLEDVAAAVRVCAEEGNQQLVLLQCTLKYPCPPQDINLRMMETLRQTFRFPVGLSDHSMGISIPMAAAALGACALEKHYTLDKTAKGSPDHGMSVDPYDLRQLVLGVRQVEAAMGRRHKHPVPAEVAAYTNARRSVTAARAIPAGKTIEPDDLTCKRPGSGITAAAERNIVGLIAARDIPEDTTLAWSDVR